MWPRETSEPWAAALCGGACTREARSERAACLSAAGAVAQDTTLCRDPEDRRRGLLSIKLCLTDKSSGLLKTRLEHGIELRKRRGDGACNGSPSSILQRGDGESEFELQGLFRMKVAPTIAAHNLQLAIDGFNDVGG